MFNVYILREQMEAFYFNKRFYISTTLLFANTDKPIHNLIVAFYFKHFAATSA